MASDYMPLLLLKQGELGAVSELTPAVKHQTTPLWLIPPQETDVETGESKKSLDSHVERLPAALNRNWGPEQRFFLDTQLIDEGVALGSEPSALHWFLAQSRLLGLKTVPVTDFDRPPAHDLAVRQSVEEDGRGIAVRLQTDAVLEPDLSTSLASLLDSFGVTEGEVDLILDLGALGAANLGATLGTLVLSTIPAPQSWRSVVVLAGSFPQSMGAPLLPQAINVVPRWEWTAYETLLSRRASLPRVPTFGDYAIAHPDPLADLDFRFIKPYATIRYSIDQSFLISKGLNVRDNGFGQYEEMCRSLVAHPDYAGSAFSWGDEYINNCALGSASTGNLTTWRKVGTNHHITFVVQQVASHG